ncbi:hypothetical protein BC833DRAFT_610300 [Globomyces pollinis-pini]|nr:hypothetical protein BC833DRAFT_610300 [Globomyces pollinis-pini]
MGVLKSSSNHEVLWSFMKDSYTLTGKMYIIASPKFSHRLGTPSKRLAPEVGPEFWEEQRLKQWKLLSKDYRATFSWPVSGEINKIAEGASWSAYKGLNTIKASYGQDVGYQYTSLECLEFKQLSLSELNEMENGEKPLTPKQQLENVHQMAYDNFCILVFKPSRVDHITKPKSGVPVRNIFTLSKEGQWSVENVTP